MIALPNYIKSDYIELARQRVNRAWEHAEELLGMGGAFSGLHPYHAVPDIHREGNEYVLSYRMKADMPVPIPMRIVAGESIHQMRSALDNLAFGLCKRTFPTYVDKAKFIEEFLPSLLKIPYDASLLIQNLQPYKRGKDANMHPLRILHRLWNKDKHEAPVLLGAAAAPVWLQIGNHELVRVKRPCRGGAFKNGAEMIAFASADCEAIHDFKARFGFDVAFDGRGPGYGQSCVNTLMELNRFVRNEVIAKLEPFL